MQILIKGIFGLVVLMGGVEKLKGLSGLVGKVIG